ncbi:MFS transporter [Mycolicibacterium sp. CBMA 226]|uniref:MFS transporter n=1 Tax=Mycolicibacterium sp. CBMA 226 TaxID=2606611 RepID=UPI0012DE9D34|nr:MFS transporter [Mycolicibacterium sp. CBMA 226]MUL78451.1 MFS transporter [Mycolicibacterium sp. CBMA 226]
MTPPSDGSNGVSATRLLPLYGAGFVIALSATSVAANLAGYLHGAHATLLTLGLLLAICGGAELLLKPAFRILSYHLGFRGVLLAGLTGSALTSAAFVIAESPFDIGLARLGQGAAAAAVGLSAEAMLIQLPATGSSRSFGGYRLWKAAGYIVGPLFGGFLVAGGHEALFTTLAVVAAAVAVWAAVTVPPVESADTVGESTLDLVRRLSSAQCLRPALALAASAAAVSIGLGFLPVLATQRGLGPLAAGAVVSTLTGVAASVQLPVRRIRDAGRLADHTGIGIGLLLVAGGFALASMTSGIASLTVASGLLGAGAGLIAPLAFTYLARGNPPERLVQTVNLAEFSRLSGDFGGPLLVGTISAASTLNVGLLAVTVGLAALANVLVMTGRGTDR